MGSTVPHDPTDPAEVAAIQTPAGEPDAELLAPEAISPYGEFGQNEAAEDVIPG